MAERISLKLTDKNDWLVKAITDEQEKQNRPSFNNMVETILVSYFKERGQKNKKTAPEKLSMKRKSRLA